MRRSRPGVVRRLGIGITASAYLAAIFLAGWAAASTLWILTGISLLGLGIHWRWGKGRDGAMLGAWAPLHLVVVATGSLASALAPFAAVWLALVARVDRGALPLAIGAAAVLVPLVHWTSGRPITLGLAAGWVTIVLAVGTVIFLLMPGRESPPGEPDQLDEGAVGAPGRSGRDGAVDSLVGLSRQPEGWPETDSTALQRTLEMVRLATWADQGVLWKVDEQRRIATPLLLSGREEGVSRSPVGLEGHPLEWVVLEGMHVRAERGKKDLPVAWAAEMLLVPVDLPDGVLSLAFGSAQENAPVAEATLGGRLLARVSDLQTIERAARVDRRRVDALIGLVHRLPRELDLEPFGTRLAEVVAETLKVDGVAVSVWSADRGRGRFVGGAGAGSDVGGGFGEGESRTALAAKHGTVLRYEDLHGERPPLPLLHPREALDPAPRSAVIAPLTVDGATHGTVTVWADGVDRFDAETADYLRVLCVLAAPALGTAKRFTEMDRRASTDSLTALPNRVAFESRLATLGSHFDRYQRPFGLLILDVDHFKRFNDTWGHEAGDAALRHLGELLRSQVRDVDLPARLGGEEFVVLFPETGLPEVLDVAERVRIAVESSPVRWNGRDLPVTVSIGVCACPDSGWLPNDMLGAADTALYRSKAEGRNRVSLANPGGGNDLQRPPPLDTTARNR